MQIPLKVSEKMGKFSEHSVARMPGDFRELYGYDIDEFITLRSVDGDIVTLQVMPGLKEDAKEDPLVAYVSENMFKTLRITNIQDGIPEVEVVEGITLGCDPEFFLTDRTGEIVMPSGLFRRLGPIGYDGKMMEIRPAPSISEHVLVNNMMGLITQARNSINAKPAILHYTQQIKPTDISMIAMSNYRGESAGFHLHFGLPAPLVGNMNYNKKLLGRQIIKALDFYVGIPSIIPEGEMDNLRRTFPTSPYGKPGNFRFKKTLEYRVPGGYLLRHPVLTKGLIALGAVVVEDLVSRIRRCTDQYANVDIMIPDQTLNLLYPNVPTHEVIYNSIVAKNTLTAEANMETIMKDIRSMVGYEKRKCSIEDFFRCIESKVTYGNNIEINWRGYYHGQRQSGQMDFCSA